MISHGELTISIYIMLNIINMDDWMLSFIELSLFAIFQYFCVCDS